MSPESSCPCSSGESYQNCCQPFHLKQSYPLTAEKLMRSRFAAFVLKNEDYLLQTWEKQNRPDSIEFDPLINWQRLVINGRKKGRKKDNEGWVTFVAYYLLMGDFAGKEQYLHERSYFNRNSDGHWQYVTGEIKE